MENNITSNSSVANGEDIEHWQRQVHDFLFEYIAPFLLTIGTVGNLMAICVLRSQTFRGTSHALLLAALAFADLGVLHTGLLRHVVKVHANVDIRVYSRAACKVHYFFTYLFPHLSSWTLVLVTTERMMSLWIPLRIKVVCSLRRMAAAWTGMAAVLLGVNIHWLVLTDLKVDKHRVKCGYSVDHEFVFNHVLTWLDFALLSFIPLSIIIPSNCLIMTKVYSASKSRRSDLGLQRQQSRNQSRSLTSVNIMLLVVTFFFVFTTSPIVIYFVAFESWPISSDEEMARTYMAYSICNMLYYLNSAANFALYCVSGSHFRHALALCTKSLVQDQTRMCQGKFYLGRLGDSKGKIPSMRSWHTDSTRLGNIGVYGKATSLKNGHSHESMSTVFCD